MIAYERFHNGEMTDYIPDDEELAKGIAATLLMNPNTEKLRKKYMDNPPEGMTSEDIRRMSGDNLLDMDYFLNEDDLFDDEAGVEGFYIF